MTALRRRVRSKLWPLFRPRWWAKQRLAGDSRYYGDGGTIHSTGHVDVEVDKWGAVVSVWFRCQMLPFRQHEVGGGVGEGNPSITLTGVEVRDR